MIEELLGRLRATGRQEQRQAGGRDAPESLTELRLQNLEGLDLHRLDSFVARIDSPKLRRIAGYVARLAETEAEEYETL